MMENASTDTRTKAQKAVPASLLKQLRATAAVICYNYCFGQPSMPSSKFQRKLYNMYHGNEEFNIFSQVDLMCSGKGRYSDMYQTVQTLVTTDSVELGNDATSSAASQLVLSPVLLNFDTHIWYVSGEHFSPAMLRCPTKTLTKELCSGRFLIDLSKQAVANIKKASIIADEWLSNNEKPSGTVWEDLYRHLILNSERINPKEKVFTGMAAFICYSKYNAHGENLLNVLAKNDEDAVSGTDESRAKSRSNLKKTKDQERSIESGDVSPFNKRGYGLDSRMQMVEIAQFEEAQARDSMKQQLDSLIDRNKMLLTEREQEINLAKIICPEYDKDNEQWKRVTELSKNISDLRNEIIKEQKKCTEMNNSKSRSSMAAKFLQSVRRSDDDVPTTIDTSDDRKKRSHENITDSARNGNDECSNTKKPIFVEIDEHNTISLSITPIKSIDKQGSSVSSK